jgi:hypothetical protein
MLHLQRNTNLPFFVIGVQELFVRRGLAIKLPLCETQMINN